MQGIAKDTYISVASAARSAFLEISSKTRKRIMRAFESGHLLGRRLNEPRGWVEISMEDLERWKKKHDLPPQ